MDTHHIAFELSLPHGHCVGVHIPAVEGPLPAALPFHPDDRTHAAGFPPARQASYLAGRTALRAALARLNLPAGPLHPDPRGAPSLLPPALGSISHKRTLAVGLAARRQADEEIGVDLEELRPLRVDIARRVLTPFEKEALARAPAEEHDHLVLTHFSLKEAFFKAANAVLGPQISFQALTVTALRGPVAELAAPSLELHGFAAQGWFGYPLPGFVLASVRVARTR